MRQDIPHHRPIYRTLLFHFVCVPCIPIDLSVPFSDQTLHRPFQSNPIELFHMVTAVEVRLGLEPVGIVETATALRNRITHKICDKTVDYHQTPHYSYFQKKRGRVKKEQDSFWIVPGESARRSRKNRNGINKTEDVDRMQA